MNGQSTYEMHSAFMQILEPIRDEDLQWQPGQQRARESPINITENGRFFWAKLDPERDTIEQVEGPESADIGFRVMQRRLSKDLIMLTGIDGVLVNGLPAMRISVLKPRDSVVLGSNRMYYITRRVKPHVGAPTPAMLGKKCPFCRLPIEEETSVLSCECSAVYHNETEATRPGLPVENRIDCSRKVENCLSCSRKLRMETYLVWNPEAS